MSGFFHQDGTRPQYIRTSSLPASEARITSIGVVGAILNRGARLRGGPMRSAKRRISAHERFCVKRPHIAKIVMRARPNAKRAACPSYPQSPADQAKVSARASKGSRGHDGEMEADLALAFYSSNRHFHPFPVMLGAVNVVAIQQIVLAFARLGIGLVSKPLD